MTTSRTGLLELLLGAGVWCRVCHKEGASTGSTSPRRGKSMLSESYGVVNRLRFTRKFTPWLVPVVWFSLWLVVLDRVLTASGSALRSSPG